MCDLKLVYTDYMNSSKVELTLKKLIYKCYIKFSKDLFSKKINFKFTFLLSIFELLLYQIS